MKDRGRRNVVFIHGMFMTRLCWSEWADRWTAHGYACTAAAWPGRERSPAELRAAHPDPELGALTLEDVVAHHEAIVRGMESPPVLIGHSMGGLIVQILLQRGLGAAGVAVHPAPPKGIISLAWSFVKANWPMVSPFADKGAPYLLTVDQFAYAFVHNLPREEQQRLYDAHVVPESRKVANGPLGPIGTIDFAKPRAPLLVVSGELDRITPPGLHRKSYEAYPPSAGKTDFHLFPGRTHNVLGQEGWTEVSDFIESWVRSAIPPAVAA